MQSYVLHSINRYGNTNYACRNILSIHTLLAVCNRKPDGCGASSIRRWKPSDIYRLESNISLENAIKRGEYTIVRHIIKRFTFTTVGEDYAYRSACKLATMCGHLHIFMYLLSRYRYRLGHAYKYYATLIMYPVRSCITEIIQKNHYRILKLLLHLNIVQIDDDIRNIMLHTAVRCGNLRIYDYLVRMGYQLRNEWWRFEYDPRLVLAYLKRNIRIYIIDECFVDACHHGMHYAENTKHFRIIREIVRRKIPIHINNFKQGMDILLKNGVLHPQGLLRFLATHDITIYRYSPAIYSMMYLVDGGSFPVRIVFNDKLQAKLGLSKSIIQKSLDNGVNKHSMFENLLIQLESYKLYRID